VDVDKRRLLISGFFAGLYAAYGSACLWRRRPAAGLLPLHLLLPACWPAARAYRTTPPAFGFSGLRAWRVLDRTPQPSRTTATYRARTLFSRTVLRCGTRRALDVRALHRYTRRGHFRRTACRTWWRSPFSGSLPFGASVRVSDDGTADSRRWFFFFFFCLFLPCMDAMPAHPPRSAVVYLWASRSRLFSSSSDLVTANAALRGGTSLLSSVVLSVETSLCLPPRLTLFMPPSRISPAVTPGGGGRRWRRWRWRGW